MAMPGLTVGVVGSRCGVPSTTLLPKDIEPSLGASRPFPDISSDTSSVWNVRWGQSYQPPTAASNTRWRVLYLQAQVPASWASAYTSAQHPTKTWFEIDLAGRLYRLYCRMHVGAENSRISLPTRRVTKAVEDALAFVTIVTMFPSHQDAASICCSIATAYR